MRLATLITKARLVDLQTADRAEALHLLAESVASALPSLTTEALVRLIDERERLGSTGLGEGVAVPHVRTGAVPSLVVALGRSVHGIALGATDGQAAHLIFLLVSPEGHGGPYLRALARVAKLASSLTWRDALQSAHDPDAALAVLAAFDDTD